MSIPAHGPGNPSAVLRCTFSPLVRSQRQSFRGISVHGMVILLPDGARVAPDTIGSLRAAGDLSTVSGIALFHQADL